MKFVSYALVAAASLTIASAQRLQEPAAVAPFRIIANIYYVGTSDPTAFLIATPAGHILIDTTYADSAPLVMDSIRALGFRLEDVKIILSSHAHLDHVGGHAIVKRATGARVVAIAEDAVNLESGGAKAFHRIGSFEPVTVDLRLNDGERVTVGGVTLKAIKTPGHTEGNTTWTTTVEDGGKRLSVVFAPSMTINPGVRMTNYPPWPTIADAYASSFKVLKGLPCDVFLGPHAGFFGMRDKLSRAKTQTGANPFIDPSGYQAYLDDLEAKYLKQLTEERRTKNH
jgi:metallo-beta-lactamase class B